MFDNQSAMEQQEIEFEKDERDHEQEFSNLRPVNSRNSLLWPSMSGLVVIKDKVHTLKQFAVLNYEDPDKEPEE